MPQTPSLVSPGRAIMTAVAALALGTAVSVSSASADTLLYDNGADLGTGSASINLGDVTDSFTLSSAATVTSITFSNWVYAGSTPSTVDWYIAGEAFGDAGQNYGVGASLTDTLSGTNGDYNIYEATFSTGGIALAAGTYWLELLDESVTGADWQGSWGFSTSALTAESYSGGDTTDTAGNSFQVYGDADVSEPGSLALFGAGLAGMGFVRRRRRT